MLEINIQGRAESLVTEQNTAASVGSGDLPVFATPYMLALMEESAQKSVAPHLEEGQGTVGTRLNVGNARGHEGLGGELPDRNRRPQTGVQGPCIR